MNKTKSNLARAAMMLLFAVLGSIGAWAQSSVVTVGSTTYGHSYLPSSPDTKFSTSQQIYTSDEIGRSGLITSIAFYNYDAGSERNYDIYLSHTSKSSFETTADWVTVAETDKVFSGTINLSSGWTVIDFDVPFEYKGSQNLLLTVDDNTGKSTGYNYSIGSYSVSGHQTLFYYKSTNLDPTQPIVEVGVFHPSYTSDERKNCIQLCFETYPKPSKLEAVEVGDVSAQIQCSLRGEATAWNLRYRKVAGEGEEEQAWTVVNNLIDRSKSIEGLTALTKYEAQVQAVFPEDKLSDWTSPLVFTTACCPVEEQTEIIYAVNSNYSPWYGYAIQLMDITDENNPREAAYINPPSYQFTGGTLTLCCGHKYKVNWIYDENHSNVNGSFSLALFFETGDKFFSMARGEAPEETAELTTFVMDCTPYCTQMPQILNESGTTYNSATITFLSQTKTGQVVYSTEADFDPEKATPEDMDFEEVPQSEVPWDQPNASITLKGLQPLTAYYVRVRSVCTAEPIGVSRWSDPVMVTTGSSFDAPTQVIAEPVNSRTEKLSWSSRGNEKSHNLYYRKQAVGNPVDPSVIQTFGGGKGTGFDNGSWGDGIWSSYGDRPFSNTIFVSDVPGGSSFRFKAGNGKSGAGQTKILYGKTKKAKDKNARKTMESLDMKCLNDADRAARKKQYELLIWALEEQIKLAKKQLDEGTITQEQYDKEVAENTQKIEKHREDLEMLNALPTDAQKLEEMKTLEQKIKENNVAKAELTLKLVNGAITNEQYESEIYDLEVKNTMFKNKLSELRAITINAENSQRDGFTITSDGSFRMNNARGTRAADDDDTYIFFIRHDDPNGVLLVKDLTITPPEQIGEWTVIKNLSKTEYTLTGLDPNTAYEVMVEPIYEDGTTGSQSPITVFTTIGTETDPTEGLFAVSKEKKVQFAHGNLQYSGDIYEGTWSIAKQQYDVLGEKNIEEDYESSWPASPTDLLCWSTVNNHYGVSTYYYYDEEEAQPYFKGDFVDWGSNPALIADLGAGWSTLSKDEWNYLLNERENAAQLKSFASITIDAENKVKGLVLLPDEWNAPDGVMLSGEMTAAQWTTIEQTGAVFLPVTGHLWVYKDEKGNNQASVNGLDVIGNYWTSTPSDEESGLLACALNFNTEVEPSAGLERRLGCAVRLVKEIVRKNLEDEFIMAINDQDCTGSEVKPTLTVQVDGITLIEGTDYTVVYTDNVNVGTATVTITAVESSNYSGTASATFNIVRDMSGVFSTGNSWATYVAQEDLTTPNGVTAYVVSDANETSVTATAINYIPANVGLLLNRSDVSVTTYKGLAYSGEKATLTSKLKGNATATTSVTAYKDFVLNQDEFVLTSASSIAAGRAYLPAAVAPAGARTLSINIDGETTGIADSLIIDSQLSEWYDLSGRRLYGKPAQKGIYLHNGKVVVIK